MPFNMLWSINLPFERLSPDKGRLHTCSAPVRRSLISKETIPLGLYVLGIPYVHPGARIKLSIVCLSDSLKVDFALVYFFYLVVILYFKDLFFFTPSENFSVIFVSDLRVQKY